MQLKEGAGLSSPLNEQQIQQLRQATADLSSQQLAWISGYFWGLSQTPQNPVIAQPQAVSPSQAALKLTIIYASQTGNAREVAKNIANQAQLKGIDSQIFSADEYPFRDLVKETHLLIVASTHGEGEPPDHAIEFHEFLQSKKAPKLDKLAYAVFGLGDSSYAFFCQTAKDFDTFLSKRGAKPMLARFDCDLNDDAAAQTWREALLNEIKARLLAHDEVVIPLHGTSSIEDSHVYSKQNPYVAELLVNQKITGRDSSKDVRHIEIDLAGSGLTYAPGDALGVYYSNSSSLVEQILTQVELTGDEITRINEEAISLKQALSEHYEITGSNPQQVSLYAEFSGSKRLEKLLQDKTKLRQYANQTQLIDLLREKKTKLTVEQLTGLLRKLTPRLYSIASSQVDVGEEVHLTVGVVAYEQEGESRLGGASGFLAHRSEDVGQVRIYVEPNAHFKLPENDELPVIMVGPGTGIAPFRAFMQERDARGASGQNWLFFGERTFTQDFLYQAEWQKYLKRGLLTRLDLAFSRDQTQKVYVQDKIREQATEIWRWLEQGAYLYICGDAHHMAKDVHQAFIDVIVKAGQKDPQAAEAYLNTLRKDKRYQKDVY